MHTHTHVCMYTQTKFKNVVTQSGEKEYSLVFKGTDSGLFLKLGSGYMDVLLFLCLMLIYIHINIY